MTRHWICIVLLGLCYQACAEATLIAHASTSLESVSRNQARNYFSLRTRTWPQGNTVRVVVLHDSNPLHQRFSTKVLGLFPHQLRRSWDRYVYTGLAQAPIEVQSEAELIDYVSRTPGALGYINNTEVNHANIRIIAVN